MYRLYAVPSCGDGGGDKMTSMFYQMRDTHENRF